MSLVVFSLVLLATDSFEPRAHISLASAFADIDNSHHFQQHTVSRSEWPYKLWIRSRGRLAGEPCGGFKNWRCASGLYCERRRGTIGVCVRKKT
jgi:hypothetical protein